MIPDQAYMLGFGFCSSNLTLDMEFFGQIYHVKWFSRQKVEKPQNWDMINYEIKKLRWCYTPTTDDETVDYDALEPFTGEGVETDEEEEEGSGSGDEENSGGE